MFLKLKKKHYNMNVLKYYMKFKNYCSRIKQNKRNDTYYLFIFYCIPILVVH
jgi:hypothetical protein